MTPHDLPAILDSYNIIYRSPGRSDRSAMPLGNGETGISLWVEENGDLLFYLARSDAQTELDRNVKLGKVRIHLDPNPFVAGCAFRQELKLRDGCVEITAGDVTLCVFVDADSSTVYVQGNAATPLTVTAHVQTWRTQPHVPQGQFDYKNMPGEPVAESADVVEQRPDGVRFHHRNGPTIIPFLASLQDVPEAVSAIPDTLTHRIFGGMLSSAPAQPTRAFELKITTHSAQTPHLADWFTQLQHLHEQAPDASVARQRTAQWWRHYWNESWIFVEGDARRMPDCDPALHAWATEPREDHLANRSAVTAAYIWSKWMFACVSRGELPIRFNGMLFNLMPGDNQLPTVDQFAHALTAPPAGEPDLNVNPDDRSWGHMTLWQNLRLPYASMLARHETEPVRRLFRFYLRFQALNRLYARVFHHAQGQHSTEIIHTFGMVPGYIYGYDRTGKPVGYNENRWGGGIDVSPGLELIHFMLDYVDYTDDVAFLHDDLLPYAHDLLRYIETRFTQRADGKLVIHPIHAVETYHDTTNSLPVVAGLHAVVGRILARHDLPPAQHAFYTRYQAQLPDLPKRTHEGRTLLSPAEQFTDKRWNVECPEHYALFPFRLFGLGKPDFAMAAESCTLALKTSGGKQPFRLGARPDYPSYSGWQYVPMVLAMLGETDEARTMLEHNAALANPGHRFPAMWGPIYDAVPDADHAANLLSTLQLMLMQIDGNRILLFPAWPRDWNVRFKLHAPRQTVITGEYRAGKLTDLTVTPAARAADVVVCPPQPRGEDAAAMNENS
ncbi:MAG: hypothetical protein IT440_04470 [Phycisphaeraceae bacterium]|nr:hypothetical protein [Phycisphaeraceae bacterium]